MISRFSICLITFLSVLSEGTCFAKMPSDTVVPEFLVIGSDASVIYGQPFPKDVTRVILGSYPMVIYYASLRIFNPAQKRLTFKISCSDSKGHLVIEGTAVRDVDTSDAIAIGDDVVGRVVLHMVLDAKPNKLVRGQLVPLRGGEEYIVRLSLDNSLIGLTTFRYEKQ